jgi:hypothetical protein
MVRDPHPSKTTSLMLISTSRIMVVDTLATGIPQRSQFHDLLACLVPHRATRPHCRSMEVATHRRIHGSEDRAPRPRGSYYALLVQWIHRACRLLERPHLLRYRVLRREGGHCYLSFQLGCMGSYTGRSRTPSVQGRCQDRRKQRAEGRNAPGRVKAMSLVKTPFDVKRRFHRWT